VAVPEDMPEPASPGFREALEERILRAVAIAKGGAFILFTSYDLLNKVYSSLAPDLARLGIKALKQGETGRHALLAGFRKEQNAVLFGTDSFWGGGGCEGGGVAAGDHRQVAVSGADRTGAAGTRRADPGIGRRPVPGIFGPPGGESSSARVSAG